jgi:hypothetical protein
MSHKMLIFKLGIDFSPLLTAAKLFCVLEMCLPLGGVLPPPHTAYDNGNSEILKFFQMVSMSPRINPTTELISHEESILWNLCLGSLKVKKKLVSANFITQLLLLKAVETRAHL